MRLLRITLSALLISLVGLLAFNRSALAIAPPTAISIDTVNAYGDLLEPNDQLYLVKLTVSYAAYPTETADQAYIVHLYNDSGNETGAVTLFNNPYFHTGYGQGVISLYYPSSYVTTYDMTWGSSVSVKLEGNPLLGWTGDLPSTTANVTTWTASGGSALGNRVLFLAMQLQSAWGATYLMVESGVLTSYGENYFLSTIPQLRLIAPTIFSGFVMPAEFHERTHGIAYALTLRNQWIGTWLDLTAVGTDWGVDPIWIYGLGWTAIIIGLCMLTVGVVRTSKHISWLVTIMVIFGIWGGFYSYIIGGLLAVVCVGMLVNQLFYSKSFT